MKKKKLEICCFSVESAIKAEKYGADRIELCDNHPEGGTTPSYASVKLSLRKLGIPVNVIVRPRGGDFLYSPLEYEIIKEDVLALKKLGANGVVVGFLKSNGEIDLERTKEIVDLARPMEVTFHRAFDMCRDPLSALEQLKETGITRILTSGAKSNVMEGIELLVELVEKAGGQISIMPGCGVNDKTLPKLMERTKAFEFHSASMKFVDSLMEYFNKDVSMGGIEGIDEYKIVSVDGDKIKAMAQILNSDSH
jgi:copper homeostasis protein